MTTHDAIMINAAKKENCLRWLDRYNGRLVTNYNEINCKEIIKPKNINE